MFNMRDLPQDNKNAFGDGRSEMDDSYMAPPIDIGYSPRFMWDVGVSEQTITNLMEGIGGRGGYGSLSPPAMGYYGAGQQGAGGQGGQGSSGKQGSKGFTPGDMNGRGAGGVRPGYKPPSPPPPPQNSQKCLDGSSPKPNSHCKSGYSCWGRCIPVYGAPVTFFPVNTDPGGCSKCQQKLSADDTQKNFIGVITVTVVLLLGIGAMYAIHNYT